MYLQKRCKNNSTTQKGNSRKKFQRQFNHEEISLSTRRIHYLQTAKWEVVREFQGQVLEVMPLHGSQIIQCRLQENLLNKDGCFSVSPPENQLEILGCVVGFSKKMGLLDGYIIIRR